MRSGHFRRAVMDDAMSTFAEAAFNRDHAYMPIFLGRGEVREEHWVSVNLKSPSVLDALNAISAAAGSLSWQVQYYGPRPIAADAYVMIASAERAYSLFPPGRKRIEGK